MDSQDTIVAPITGTFGAAVQLVRVSGPKTQELVKAVVSNPEQVFKNPRKLFLRSILDEKKNPLDRGLLSYFPAPNSFTGEEVVEFHLHASPYILRRFIETLNSLGARNAEAGEFTKRAFLNGKLDLSQAEAVSDLVIAETEAQAKVAREQLTGRLSKAIDNLGEPLRNLLAEIEAYIDFPDEDIEPSKSDAWRTVIQKTIEQLNAYTDSYSLGKIYRDGAQVVLAGVPNAGKSSLLNALVGSERVIVTPIAGTTRDTIEERISLGGIFVNLWDTAGLVSSEQGSRVIDEVEKKGVEISWEKISSADLVLFVFDPEQDKSFQLEFMQQVQNKATGVVLPVLNKSDIEGVNQFLDQDNVISVSAKNNEIKSLKTELLKYISTDLDKGSLLICNARHYASLCACTESLKKASISIGNNTSAEFVSFDIRQGLNHLIDIVGVSPSDEILGRIFSKFCIGK